MVGVCTLVCKQGIPPKSDKKSLYRFQLMQHFREEIQSSLLAPLEFRLTDIGANWLASHNSPNFYIYYNAKWNFFFFHFILWKLDMNFPLKGTVTNETMFIEENFLSILNDIYFGLYSPTHPSRHLTQVPLQWHHNQGLISSCFCRGRCLNIEDSKFEYLYRPC